MLFRQLGLGRAVTPSYRDKEAPRRQQDQSKTTWKGTVYVILELNLRRIKGQPVDAVMNSMSLHLKTPDDHPEAPIDMHERH